MDTGRVLITGMSGFTGTHLYAYLQEVALDAEIFGLDIQRPSYDGNYEFVQADLRDRDRIFDLICQVKPTRIFHLAGLNFSDDPKLFYDINVIGTVNLLEAVRKNRTSIDPKVLIVGSSAEYGIVNEDELPISEETPLRPTSHYGVSKVAQELLGFHYFNSYALKVILVRPFNLVGPGQSDSFVCGALVKQIVEIEKGIRRQEMLVGNLEPERDFIDVRDVVRAYWQLMSVGRDGEVYNIGSGRCYSIREVLEILLREVGMEIAIRQDKKRMRQSDVPRQISNINKIRETGWTPKISLEESLRDMLNYLVQH